MFSERRRDPVLKGTGHWECINSHAEVCFPSFALDSEGLESQPTNLDSSQLILL